MDSLKRLLIGGALAAIWLFVCSFSTMSPLAAETGTIAASASLPDLAVTALTVSPEIPLAGDVMTISVTVQNIGGTASPSCTLACFIDEQPLATNQMLSLPGIQRSSLLIGKHRVVHMLCGLLPIVITRSQSLIKTTTLSR